MSVNSFTPVTLIGGILKVVDARTLPGFGLVMGVTSAVSFGTSGPLAKGLIDSGWSSAAVTAVRLGAGSLLLLVPLILLRRNLFAQWARSPMLVIAYGILGVAVVQLLSLIHI